MGEKSGISWTDHTFNPWWGCVKVSPACTNCYAAAFDHRLGGDHWGLTSERKFFGEKHWREPLKWNARATKRGVRERVFCASMADVFEDREDLRSHRARLFDLILETPMLDWLLLTKRPENLPRMLPWCMDGTHDAWSNVYMGRKGHVGTYGIRDEHGTELPIQFGYRSGPEPYRGYFFYGSDECLTWTELRKRWPQYLKTRNRLYVAGRKPTELGTTALPMVVIYERPKDLPDGFVVRLWDVYPGRVALNNLLGQDLGDLEAARALVPGGMVNIGRTDEDDAKIVEVWV